MKEMRGEGDLLDKVDWTFFQKTGGLRFDKRRDFVGTIFL